MVVLTRTLIMDVTGGHAVYERYLILKFSNGLVEIDTQSSPLLF